MQQQVIDFFTKILSYLGITEPMISSVLGTFTFLFIELMLLFILISFFVGLLQSYISREKIQRALTTKYRFLNSILGAVLGSITPFCSCSTIPLLVGLRKSRAPFAGMVSFLLTSPILNPMIIIIFFGFFGFVPTLLYAGIALVFAIVAGYILDRLGFERYFKDNKVANFDESASCCDTPSITTEPCDCDTSNDSYCETTSTTSNSCGCTPSNSSTFVNPSHSKDTCDCTVSSHDCNIPSKEENNCCDSTDISFKGQKGTLLQRHRKVWKFSFCDAWEQFKKILLYLLIGAGIGSFIYGFVPEEFLMQVAGKDNPFAVPLAAILGVPMYIRTEAVLPLANLLIGQGVGLGTMVALIIGGAGASIPEVSLLSTLFKKQFIITFLLCIFTVAVISGYAFNILL